MHIHILGICGTFMGSLAILARELGFQVSGCDQNVYPPMSTQLEAANIELMEGFRPEHLDCGADLFVVGNAMARGNPIVEALLNRQLPYVSGPQWLADHVLQGRWVLACAGTHGKTTTSSMLAWILDYAGMAPGFLIGGVPGNFGLSARLGETDFFVIEADEYDTAFFDKRSKFIHYRPRTAILNNLEFDHADIFPDLEAIQRQFHHLVRTVPAQGLLITPEADQALNQVLSLGCWTPVETFSTLEEGAASWKARLEKADGSCFQVLYQGRELASVTWKHTGVHNVHNALAAIAAAHHVGVVAEVAVEALCRFDGVKRRMEVRGQVRDVTVYDDFAHHPTAIASTLEGLRQKEGVGRIVAVIEPRSNTMRMGVHGENLSHAASVADRVFWYQPEGQDWGVNALVQADFEKASQHSSVQDLIDTLVAESQAGDQVVIMSNGGFEGIHDRLLMALDKPEVTN